VLLILPQVLDETTMKTFQYRAIDQIGRQIKGRMEAHNITDLETRLCRIGLDLTIAKSTKRMVFTFVKHKVSHRDLVLFCFQLEQLMTAGVPMLEGLSDLTAATENIGFKKVLGAVSASVEGGKTLSQSLAAHPDMFDEVFIHMVRAGEQTGELPTVFNHLCQTLKWQDAMFAQLKRLLSYPLFILIVVMAAVTFLMIFLVPELIKFMQSIGQALPWNTKVLVSISNAFVHYWWLMVALPMVVISLLALWVSRSQSAHYTIDRIKLNLPILGEILNKIIMARFARYFSLLYRTGIPILTAIKTCEDIVGNRVIASALHSIHDSIHAGHTMSDSFKEADLFPSLVIRMISVGERSGGLDQALMNVSYFYDRDVEERLQKMLTMMEPALTVILGLLLLFIMAAVLGPVYQSFSQMQL
jgi:type IV pilus assembly protein PilC